LQNKLNTPIQAVLTPVTNEVNNAKKKIKKFFGG
jgi:hypothetical protein